MRSGGLSSSFFSATADLKLHSDVMSLGTSVVNVCREAQDRLLFPVALLEQCLAVVLHKATQALPHHSHLLLPFQPYSLVTAHCWNNADGVCGAVVYAQVHAASARAGIRLWSSEALAEHSIHRILYCQARYVKVPGSNTSGKHVMESRVRKVGFLQ